MIRTDRQPNELRKSTIHTEGPGISERSILIEIGHTVILCSASVENRVPRFLRNQTGGWLTAEYGMLPGSTTQRKKRSRGPHLDGRDQEIQRLIGRSLRAIIDLETLGERTITLDCDVLQADGGTRTASITGAYVALVRLLRNMQSCGELKRWPILSPIAATSVGIVNGYPLLDLEYREDSIAQVDLNIVMNGKERMIEIQGTAEGHPFDRKELDNLLDLATHGIRRLFRLQKETIDRFPVSP